MTGTLIGQFMREAVQQDVSVLPLEVICVCDDTVKLIVSLSYQERAPKPFLIRAWDWLGSGPGGSPRKVRGKLRILTINGCGELLSTSVYPPERMPEV